MGAKYTPRAKRGKNPQSMTTVAFHLKRFHGRRPDMTNAELLALETVINYLTQACSGGYRTKREAARDMVADMQRGAED